MSSFGMMLVAIGTAMTVLGIVESRPRMVGAGVALSAIGVVLLGLDSTSGLAMTSIESTEGQQGWARTSSSC